MSVSGLTDIALPTTTLTRIERSRPQPRHAAVSQRRQDGFGVVLADYANPVDVLPKPLGEAGARAQRLDTLRGRDSTVRLAGGSRIAGATKDASVAASDQAGGVERAKAEREHGDARGATRQAVSPGSANAVRRSDPAALKAAQGPQHPAARPAGLESDRTESPPQTTAARGQSPGENAIHFAVANEASRPDVRPANPVAVSATHAKGNRGPTSSPKVPSLPSAQVSGPATSARSAPTPAKGGQPPVPEFAPNDRGKETDTASQRRAGTADSSKERSSDVRAQSLIQRIARVIQARFDGRNTVAHLRLDPPSLGRLQVHINMRGDALTLRMGAETSAARDLLASRMDSLRAALADQGLRVDRVEMTEAAAAQPSHEFNTSSEDPGHGDHRSSFSANTFPQSRSDGSTNRQSRRDGRGHTHSAKSAPPIPSIAPSEAAARVDDVIGARRVDVRV